MAAKSKRGSLKDSFTSQGKPYFFDQSTVDQIKTCYSCHAGGGPAEGIVQPNGTVIPYTDPSLTPTHDYDRDFYTYDAHVTTQTLISKSNITDTMKAVGKPVKHDWHKSGVMEADCLLCHIDPEKYTYTSADGLKAQSFRPRLMIFAGRQNGKVNQISVGMPLASGLLNESAFPYTNDVQRMSRPTKMLSLMQLPKENVGEMFQMWTEGLKQIEKSGVLLPYALYGENVQKIWDQNGIKAAYCANPNGPADEMQRLMNAKPALDQLFQGFLTYMKQKGFLPANATMQQMMGMFFNDFVYAYRIKMNMGQVPPQMEQFMPLPSPLKAYEPGNFYTDWDNANSEARDYVRAPLVEGEGIPYSGDVGIGYGAMMYAMGMAMQGNTKYLKADGSPDISKVITDVQYGAIPKEHIPLALHDYLPSFFYLMPVAEMMGLDINQDGSPATYVQLVKQGEEWIGKSYYNTADLGNDVSLKMEMFGSTSDINSHKWVKVCGQCHIMTQDHGNSEWTRARLYNLGMDSDFVKNGQFIRWTNDKEAPGYDVHMSSKKMGCGSCHLRNSGSIEDKHNFLKGTDTAHMVRNDLDNNPKPRTCESCHIYGEDRNAPNPVRAHEEKFGENAGRHITLISCEACHQPYKRTWRFRSFDDTLGYYGNFDNRLGFNVLPGGDKSMMAFPAEYALPPVYGVSPGYGIPHFNMLSHHINADGSGKTVAMDFVSQMVDYFNMNGSADPGKLVNGMPTNPAFDFWNYFYNYNLDLYKSEGMPISYVPQYNNEVYPPLYWANGRNGYPQIRIGNPITIMTWVDANPQPDHDMSDIAYNGAKVLYLREINAAIKSFYMPAVYNVIPRATLKNIPPNDPSYAKNPNIGKIVLKDSGYVIFDHTGDMYPDIWWPEDVKAMQEALIKVLKAEGVTNPMPAIFMAAHYFSDSHGILPAEKALGATSCNDCHGSSKDSAGAHRITDRIINFLPWAPPWFSEANRLLKYDPSKVTADAPIWMKRSGMILNNANGYFIVDGEVAYITPITANNVSVLGAKAEDLLKLSYHHAEELFYMVAEGKVKGYEITDITDLSGTTPAELEAEYVKQVVNGPWSDKQYVYLPERLKSEIAECGFFPQPEWVYLSNKGFAEAFVFTIGFHEDSQDSFFIRLPSYGPAPEIWTKSHEEEGSIFKLDKTAKIVGYSGSYVVVKVNHQGEFAAVEKGSGSMGPLTDLWKAFSK